MPVRLIPSQSGKSIKLDKPVVLIGRNPDCEVVLPKSRKVSRNHCLVACVDNRIVVRDLGSTNGVWVNGQRVEREARIRLGDELSVADVKYHLVNVDAQDGNDHQAENKKADGTASRPVAVPNHPIALPDEDDSFMVEASSPRLPRVRPDQIAADEGLSAQSSGDSSCDVIPLDDVALGNPDEPVPPGEVDSGDSDAPILLDDAALGNPDEPVALDDAAPGDPDEPILLARPVTGAEIELDRPDVPDGSRDVMDGEFQMRRDDDDDESDEAFSILDSVDESDDIIPLAPIDDD